MLLRALTLPFVSLLLGTIPVAVGAQEFGKNKVQYRTFDWKYIQSANFDVYYYDKAGLNLATFTAYVAEDALSSIQKNVRFSLTDRVSIIVYNSKNHFQQTNVVNAYMPEGVGGVTELYKNRIVVPFEGEWEKFRHVIHHELVHAVLNDKFYGGSVQSLISNDIQVDLPIWMNEGLAEFEAHDGYNSETDMFVRDAVIGEYLPELYRMSGFFAYRGGQAFYWYVAENYGRDKIGELLDRLRSTSLDEAFRGAFGKGIKEFSDQFSYDMKVLYWPDIADRTRPQDFAEVLTSHVEEESFMNASPSISPDGSMVGYISDRDGSRSVYLMELAGDREVRQLFEGERNVEFEELHLLSPRISWSPDSRSVAMAVKSRGSDVIMMVNVESGEKRRIELPLEAIYSVAWSHGGAQLAFQGIIGDMSDIYTYDIKSGVLENRTGDIYSDFDPVWSTDDRSLYFLSDRAANGVQQDSGLQFRVWEYDFQQIDLYQLDLASGALGRVTSDEAREKSPFSGPDQSYFFISNRNGIDNIYHATGVDSTPRPLTNSITGIEQLSATPDGSKMVFSAWNGTGYDLFLLRSPMDETLGLDSLEMTTYARRVLPVEEGSAGRDLVEVDEGAAQTALLGYGEVTIDLEEAVVASDRGDVVDTDVFLPSGELPSGALSPEGDFLSRDYKVKLSTDIIQATGGYSSFYGPQGVIQALFSDELGDHRILVATDLQLDLNNSDFYLTYDYLANRTDYRVGLFQEAVLFRVGSFGDITRFRERGVSTKLSYPLDRFRRVEGSFTFMNVSRESISRDGFLPDQSKFMALPGVGHVFDNTESLLLSPVRGSRYYNNVTFSPKIGENGVGFVTLETDFRHYIPLDKWGLWDIAMRFTGGASFGGEPQQFYVGGIDGFWINSDFADDGIPIENAEDYSLFSPVFPLRGYDWGEALGSKYGLVNLELRYPLLIGGSGGVLASLLQFVTGTAFVDVAAAWDDELSLTRELLDGRTVVDDLRIGTGFGLRSFLLGLPVRFDIAWRYDLDAWTGASYYISLGSDF